MPTHGVDEKSGDGNKLVGNRQNKQAANTRAITPGAKNGRGDELTADASVGALGQRFRFAARGLWAGGLAAFALVVVMASMSSFPEQRDMMWLLGVAMGGLMGTAAMHGRLADNRAELLRVREELDRKAAEYSKLLSKVLDRPLSSKGKKDERKKETKQ